LFAHEDDAYMPTISARIDDEAFAELERVAELLDGDRSTTIRKALEEGLTELRVREAVGRYQQGDVSSNEAARIAGVSVAEWLEIARERNLTTQLSAEDLRRDAEAAQEL
jgi:predicted HTH domain antitoxin